MKYVLPSLIIVFILLFLLRREFKEAVLKWMENDSASGNKELEEVVAQEKQRTENSHGREGRQSH